MREIKFRAKTIRAGKWSKWIYGSLDFTKYTYQEARMVGYDDPSQYWHKIDKNTIGQFTGLKDKNGKDIYEGDILKYMAIADGEQIDSVIFDRGTFVVDYAEDYKQPINEINHCSEVIGNIYDNPELLEK